MQKICIYRRGKQRKSSVRRGARKTIWPKRAKRTAVAGEHNKLTTALHAEACTHHTQTCNHEPKTFAPTITHTRAYTHKTRMYLQLPYLLLHHRPTHRGPLHWWICCHILCLCLRPCWPPMHIPQCTHPGSSKDLMLMVRKPWALPSNICIEVVKGKSMMPPKPELQVHEPFQACTHTYTHMHTHAHKRTHAQP